MPMLGRLRVLRSWGGIMDMSMDGSPIIDRTPLDGLYLNAGWCYGGFKATPASGWCFAHLIARDEPHPSSRAAYPARPLRHRPPDRREGRRRPAEPALKQQRMRIPCPYLRRARHRGVRLSRRCDACRGPTRPDATSCSDGSSYVYLRDNPAGLHRELWYHGGGCRTLAGA